jgi:hypothetical protein
MIGQTVSLLQRPGEARRGPYRAPESGQTTEPFRKLGPFDHMWFAVSLDETSVLVGEGP